MCAVQKTLQTTDASCDVRDALEVDPSQSISRTLKCSVTLPKEMETAERHFGLHRTISLGGAGIGF